MPEYTGVVMIRGDISINAETYAEACDAVDAMTAEQFFKIMETPSVHLRIMEDDTGTYQLLDFKE